MLLGDRPFAIVPVAAEPATNTAELSAPVFVLSATGYVSPTGVGGLSIPIPEVTAVGSHGNSATLVCPLPQLTAEGYIGNGAALFMPLPIFSAIGGQPLITFEPTQIWPGYTVTGTAIEINIADLPGLTPGLAAEDTGDAREVLYRVLLSAGTFYEGKDWDKQAQTGKVRVSDQYTYYSSLGEVLRRIIQAQVTLDIENGGVIDEPT